MYLFIYFFSFYMAQQADKTQPRDSCVTIPNLVINIWGISMGETSAGRNFCQLAEQQEYRNTSCLPIKIQTQHQKFRKPQEYTL
jgi:hypothetical protein